MSEKMSDLRLSPSKAERAREAIDFLSSLSLPGTSSGRPGTSRLEKKNGKQALIKLMLT